MSRPGADEVPANVKALHSALVSIPGVSVIVLAHAWRAIDADYSPMAIQPRPRPDSL